MFVIRAGLFALLATVAFSQTSSLTQRLSHSLAGSSEASLALQELSQKEFLPLEELLARRALLDPSNKAELTALEGAVAFLAGDMHAAVTQFLRSAELAPLIDGDSFTLAMALVNLGEDQRAAGILSSLANKYPQESIYVYWLGRIDYNLRRYPEAAAKLQKALELAPASARGWDSLGLTFDMQGQLEQAYGAFVKAVKLNRGLPHPSAWPPHDLGYLCFRMNKLKEAEISLRESLNFDPNLAVSHYHLARTLESEGEQQGAIVEYKAAILKDSISAEPCYSLAMLYRRSHQEAEAATMFAEYKKRKEAQ